MDIYQSAQERQANKAVAAAPKFWRISNEWMAATLFLLPALLHFLVFKLGFTQTICVSSVKSTRLSGRVGSRAEWAARNSWQPISNR